MELDNETYLRVFIGEGVVASVAAIAGEDIPGNPGACEAIRLCAEFTQSLNLEGPSTFAVYLHPDEDTWVCNVILGQWDGQIFDQVDTTVSQTYGFAIYTPSCGDTDVVVAGPPEITFDRFFAGYGKSFTQVMDMGETLDSSLTACEAITLCANHMVARDRGFRTIIVIWSIPTNDWGCWGTGQYYNNPGDWQDYAASGEGYGFSVETLPPPVCEYTSLNAPSAEATTWNRFYLGAGRRFAPTLSDTVDVGPSFSDCEAIELCLEVTASSYPTGGTFILYELESGSYQCQYGAEFYDNPADFSVPDTTVVAAFAFSGVLEPSCSLTEYITGAPPNGLTWELFAFTSGRAFAPPTQNRAVYPADTEPCLAVAYCAEFAADEYPIGGTFVLYSLISGGWACDITSELYGSPDDFSVQDSNVGEAYGFHAQPGPCEELTEVVVNVPELTWERFAFTVERDFDNPLPYQTSLGVDESCSAITRCAQLVADQFPSGGTMVVWQWAGTRDFQCGGSAVFYDNPDDFRTPDPNVGFIFGFNAMLSPDPACEQSEIVAGDPELTWERFQYTVGHAFSERVSWTETISLNVPICDALIQCAQLVSTQSGRSGGTMTFYEMYQSDYICEWLDVFYDDPALFDQRVGGILGAYGFNALPQPGPEACESLEIPAGDSVWERYYFGSEVSFLADIEEYYTFPEDVPACDVLMECGGGLIGEMTLVGTMVVLFSTETNLWHCFGAPDFFDSEFDFGGANPSIQQIYGFNTRVQPTCEQAEFVVGDPEVQYERYFSSTAQAPLFQLDITLVNFDNSVPSCEAIQQCVDYVYSTTINGGGTVFIGFDLTRNLWSCSGSTEYHTDAGEFGASSDYAQVYALSAEAPVKPICQTLEFTTNNPTVMWTRFLVDEGVVLFSDLDLPISYIDGAMGACDAVELCLPLINQATAGGGTTFLALNIPRNQWVCMGTSQYYTDAQQRVADPDLAVVYAISAPPPPPQCALTAIESTEPSLVWTGDFVGRRVSYQGSLDIPAERFGDGTVCEIITECINHVNEISGGGGSAIITYDDMAGWWLCQGSSLADLDLNAFSWDINYGEVYAFTAAPPQYCDTEDFVVGEAQKQWHRYMADYGMLPTFPLGVEGTIIDGVSGCQAVQQCIDYVSQSTGGSGTAFVVWDFNNDGWFCAGSPLYRTDPTDFVEAPGYGNAYAFSSPPNDPVCEVVTFPAGQTTWDRYFIGEGVRPLFTLEEGPLFIDPNQDTTCNIIQQCIMFAEGQTFGGGTIFLGFRIDIQMWECSATAAYRTDPNAVTADTGYGYGYLVAGPPQPRCVQQRVQAATAPSTPWGRNFYGVGVVPNIPLSISEQYTIPSTRTACEAQQECVDHINSLTAGSGTAVLMRIRNSQSWLCQGDSRRLLDTNYFAEATLTADVYAFITGGTWPPPQADCDITQYDDPQTRTWDLQYYNFAIRPAFAIQIPPYDVQAPACNAVSMCMDHISDRYPDAADGLTAIIYHREDTDMWICTGSLDYQTDVQQGDYDYVWGQTYVFSTPP